MSCLARSLEIRSEPANPMRRMKRLPKSCAEESVWPIKSAKSFDDRTGAAAGLPCSAKPVWDRLHARGFDGGNYWGIPRSTHDIDFVIEYEAKDIGRIIDTFEDEFFIQRTSVQSALNPPFQFNALDNRSAMKVDFFRLAGDDYELERFKRRMPIKLLDIEAFIATPEDIVLHKLRWYTISPSDRQLKDAAGIVSISGHLMDAEYLNHWAKKIKVSELLEQVRGIANPDSDTQ